MVTCTSTHPLGNPMKIPWNPMKMVVKCPIVSSKIIPCFHWLVVSTYPSAKWWTSSLGMIFHSQYDGKVIIHSCSKSPTSQWLNHGETSSFMVESVKNPYPPPVGTIRAPASAASAHFIATWCAAEPQRRKDSRGSRGLVDGDFAYPKAGGSEQTRNGDVELIHVS